MSQTICMEEQEQPKQENELHLKELSELSNPEEKLKTSIALMREALAQPASPNFRSFWDIRKICLPLFKESLSAQVRSQLWDEYVELTKEGRRLKEILDEESAFAAEQIDLAVSALESEVQGYLTHREEILEKTATVEFPQTQTLQASHDFYQKFQKQLILLNLYASRINALRKELIRTEMRIRQKNKLFQRLSLLGDHVFPARKELIREISDSFIRDVEEFAETYFSDANFNENEARRSVFFFREEIKNLQTIAKILTLNTHAFSATREMLSRCWDKLKGMEKELKKEYAEQKQKSSENANQVKERIDAMVQSYATGALSFEEGAQELDEISRWMRSIQLTRHDVQWLRELLQNARAPLELKKTEENQERRLKEAEFEKIRQEKVNAFKAQVAELQNKLAHAPIDILTGELDEARKTLPMLSLSKVERQHLERILKVIRDQIAEKQSHVLLTLSDDDRAALTDLEQILEQRSERRREIKHQIEDYRKIIGGSGLDFEKAMRYNELMEIEKESLAKIDENIQEIQKKMRLLKKST